MLHREERPARRKLILLLSLVFNLGLLSFFKYHGFFIESVNALAGPGTLRSTLDVVLPAGISFYTFQSMGYSIDVYRRDLEPSRSIVEFAAFVSLFPQLIAGPIVRPKLRLPQLAKNEPVDNSRVFDGAMLFTCGLLKKVLVADRLAFLADPILNAPRQYGSIDLRLAMAAFSLQIYFDFSGYTDMARGLARMLGLEFSINFDSPYRADSPSDFWLAHQPVDVAARLPLHPARRQPEGNASHRDQPAGDDAARRPLARRRRPLPRGRLGGMPAWRLLRRAPPRPALQSARDQEARHRLRLPRRQQAARDAAPPHSGRLSYNGGRCEAAHEATSASACSSCWRRCRSSRCSRTCVR